MQQLHEQLVQLRGRQSAANEQFNTVQATYYQASAAIDRHEQAIAHQHNLQHRQQDALQQSEANISDTLRHLAEDRNKRFTSQQKLTELVPQESEHSALLALQEAQLLDAEQAWQDWQNGGMMYSSGLPNRPAKRKSKKRAWNSGTPTATAAAAVRTFTTRKQHVNAAALPGRANTARVFVHGNPHFPDQ